MRYVVIGAGAVGGALGGRLHQHGREVVLVARGPHLDAMRQRGLALRDPDGEVVLDVTAVGDPGEVRWRGDDVVVLATKSQQTAAVLDRLMAVAPDVPIVCAQNGVANERAALRCFEAVHGIPVQLPSTHLEPGVVLVHSAPCTGVVDVGLAAGGTDGIDDAIAVDLAGSSFSSRPIDDVAAWKRAKLLRNLDNAIEAACGEVSSDSAVLLRERSWREAEACFEAAEWRWVDDETFTARRRDLVTWRPVDGGEGAGSSTAQSLARGAGTEVDFLNGEIVLLGRLHGRSTPANTLLQRTVRRMALEGAAPGSVPATDLVASLPPAG